MLNEKPPTLAVSLLKRLDHGELLTGDLVEKYAQQRSLVAFWRHLLATIATSVWRDIRGHKLIAIGGSITGWLSLACFAAVAARLLTAFGGPSVHAARWHWPQYALLFVIGFAYSAGSAWIVGHVHRAHRTAAVFGYLGSVLIASVCAPAMYYWLVPSFFFSTIVPHLPFLLTANLVGGPASIVVGGLWSAPHEMRRAEP